MADISATSVWGRIPRRGRLMGVDYGTRRIGIAVCDPDQTLASPAETIESHGPEADRSSYRRVIEKWGPRAIVVGLPLHADGGESPMSIQARLHAAWLHATFELPCLMHDERYTSLEASAVLYEQDATNKQRKSRIDNIAASLLLQSYLDRLGDAAM